MYIGLLEHIVLLRMVLFVAFLKVLLRSDLIKSSSEERSLLKNLGSWLGKLTIGRNQALRAIEIDPKVLITEASEVISNISLKREILVHKEVEFQGHTIDKC